MHFNILNSNLQSEIQCMAVFWKWTATSCHLSHPPLLLMEVLFNCWKWDIQKKAFQRLWIRWPCIVLLEEKEVPCGGQSLASEQNTDGIVSRKIWYKYFRIRLRKFGLRLKSLMLRFQFLHNFFIACRHNPRCVFSVIIPLLMTLHMLNF